MQRYDLNRSTYKPAIQVAQYDERFFDSIRFGDVVAMHNGRVGITWERSPGYPPDFETVPRQHSIIPVSELPQLVEQAHAVLDEWAKQQAAEIRAETAIPQYLVW